MLFDLDKYAMLYSCCIPVEGASRSIICDLQRNTFITIPKQLLGFTKTITKYPLTKYKDIYSDEDIEILETYIQLLLKNEFLFFTNNPDMFPPINISKWEEPSLITNSIIDIGEIIYIDFKKTFSELSQLGCKHIQIRSFVPRNLTFFDTILSMLEEFNLLSIELIACYDKSITSIELESFITRNNYVTSLIIHSVPDDIIKQDTIPTYHKVWFTDELIHDETCCGVITPSHFSINIKLFTESQNFNSCLNRKISIDKNGNIKNCPSFNKSFGSAVNTSLIEIVTHNETLKFLWKLNKDQVKVCKDCEFRYICTDCRAYLTNNTDIYSKPLKCKYDPYSNSGFPNL